MLQARARGKASEAGARRLEVGGTSSNWAIVRLFVTITDFLVTITFFFCDDHKIIL